MDVARAPPLPSGMALPRLGGWKIFVLAEPGRSTKDALPEGETVMSCFNATPTDVGSVSSSKLQPLVVPQHGTIQLTTFVQPI